MGQTLGTNFRFTSVRCVGRSISRSPGRKEGAQTEKELSDSARKKQGALQDAASMSRRSLTGERLKEKGIRPVAVIISDKFNNNALVL
mmetsp:Transcript_5568/g.16617  ORF Transcript_5568/g.16617 Transcript_5568/m.16617 type:complete len:88 (+) Transcript_5568:461-724(+)